MNDQTKYIRQALELARTIQDRDDYIKRLEESVKKLTTEKVELQIENQDLIRQIDSRQLTLDI